MKPLLEVLDLHVAYRNEAGVLYAALVRVSFELQAGEVLGVLGESGSGKSTLAASLLRLLPANGTIVHGVVRLEGHDLFQMRPWELEKVRAGHIGIVFQEPSLALHPTIRVREQIRDVIVAHESLDPRSSEEKTLKLLETLFASDAKRIGNSYAHQLSGGQRQRVLIAQAIACNPSLLIADEPTASLDPSTQTEILLLLQSLRQQLGLAVILISHNPAVLAGFADRLLVLYAGRVVETGPVKEVLTSPKHPYTQSLLRCLPPQLSESSSPRKVRLEVIVGEPPNLARLSKGCSFEPRCNERMGVCTARDPEEVILSANRAVSCFKYGG